jgi:CelD/BcsL family acetyltransferase involved in cellulose biosynthesis
MRISVVHPAELDETERDAWREFQRQDVRLDNPFLAPEFTLAVARARESVRVAVLWDGDGIAGFFPFEVRGLVGRPVGAGISDCQGLIHRPGLEWDPVALIRACRLPVWEFDHLLASQHPFAPHHLRRQGSPIMDLSGGFEGYLRQRREATGGSIKSVLRKRRKLAREWGEVRLAFDVRDEELLATLMRWKSAQYRRTRQRDRFASGWINQVVRDLSATRATGCVGTLCGLYAADRLVAVDFGLRSGSVLVDWFPAYDPAGAAYSPGVLLSLAMAEAAAAAGIGHIDLGKGKAEFKDMLASSETPVCEGMVVASRPLGLVRRTRHRAWTNLRESHVGRRLRSSRVGELLKLARARVPRA